MSPHAHGDHLEDHDQGLAHDLPRLVSRRGALGVLAGGLGSLALAACGSDATTTTPPAATDASSASGAGAVAAETAGPFPGDGSNGPNVLAESGVVREDITKSVGSASGTASGVPMRIELKLVDVAAGGGPLAGAAVYIWHCDAEGRYSLYDPGAEGENYLRGVQESGADGALAFDSVWPGAYPGRWPHIHFEVYESLDAATAGGAKLRTSQLALPEEACRAVYGASGYEQSAENIAQVSLDGDGVFSDGYATQLASASGSPTDGMTITLNVGV